MNLLKQKSSITHKSSYEEFRNELESDFRCTILPKYLRTNIFNEYVKSLQEKIINDYKKMLKETIYVTKDSATEGEDFNILVKLLREADLRFRYMDSYVETRDKILKEHIIKLKKYYELK